MSTIGDFINQYIGLAQSVSAQTGLPTDFVLGQAALETGWGTSGLAQNNNNFFGIGGPGGFQSYSSPAQGFQAYANLISSNNNGQNNYMSAVGAGDATQMAQALASAGYTPDAGYASSVGQTVQTIDQALGSLGTPAGSGPMTATTPGGASVGVSQASDPVSQFFSLFTANVASIIIVIIGIILMFGAVVMFANSQGVDVPGIAARAVAAVT